MFAPLRSKLFLLAWAGLITFGFSAAWKYETVSGSASNLARRPSGATTDARLMMFVHPECPCTRASLAGLRQLVAEGLDPARMEVVVVGDHESFASLLRSTNAVDAKRISNVKLTFDPDGALAAKFGAETSGQVFLFDPDGTVRFRGGITDLRGHEGPSVGLESLRQGLRGEIPSVRETRVLGCDLHRSAVER